MEQSPQEFTELLTRFSRAVEANDGAGLADLFSLDGVYEDGFYGPHAGHGAITGMLARFHADGRDFRWSFFDPVRSGTVAYARYCFSYLSRLDASLDRPVVFEGISRFLLQGDLIVHYFEVFDRGVAMAQLGFAPERLRRRLDKLVAHQNLQPHCLAHLARWR